MKTIILFNEKSPYGAMAKEYPGLMPSPVECLDELDLLDKSFGVYGTFPLEQIVEVHFYPESE